MNTIDGYWIYSDDPRAADHALTGSVVVADGDVVLLATDGFARLVDVFGRYASWRPLVDEAVERGLADLGDELRSVERGDPDGHRYPRIKRHDDATALLLRVVSTSPGRPVT